MMGIAIAAARTTHAIGTTVAMMSVVFESDTVSGLFTVTPTSGPHIYIYNIHNHTN